MGTPGGAGPQTHEARVSPAAAVTPGNCGSMPGQSRLPGGRRIGAHDVPLESDAVYEVRIAVGLVRLVLGSL